MASYQKFSAFAQDIGRKVHNLNSDSLKVMLTDVAPVATNAVKADITDIAAGNGYTSGGAVVGGTAYSQSGGTATLTGSNVVFTASGGSMATFRYAVLYNNTAAGGPLIAWFDYGAEVTLATGESFTVAWTGGNIFTEA